MEGSTFTNNFTLYLMLIVCVTLVTVDIIEIYRLSNTWIYALKANAGIFEKCLKYELLLKTVFAGFSFFAALSAFTLTLFLVINVEFFIDKVLNAFLNFNYFLFGPYMLGFCILGCIHWNEVVYVCNAKDINQKVFSLSNMFSIVICMILSCVITIGISVYETIKLYVDSILRREEGFKIIRSLFWFVVLRQRSNEEILRSRDDNNVDTTNIRVNRVVEEEEEKEGSENV